MQKKLNSEMFCEDCGQAINKKDTYYIYEYPYCCKCYYKNKYYKGIHDYDYKSNPVFHGDGNIFFKVVLEVINGGFLDINAEKILDIANIKFEDRLYIKSDERLENGFLIVSQLMTIEYHKKYMPWKKIMAELEEMGYKSYKTIDIYCIKEKSLFRACKIKGTLNYYEFISEVKRAAESLL